VSGGHTLLSFTNPCSVADESLAHVSTAATLICGLLQSTLAMFLQLTLSFYSIWYIVIFVLHSI